MANATSSSRHSRITRLRCSDSWAEWIEGVEASEVTRVMSDPDRVLFDRLSWPVKLSHESFIVVAELALSDGPISVAFKRYQAKSWLKSVLGLFRTSKARIAWRRGNLLVKHGISIARPVLLIEPPWWRRGRKSYLASLWMEGSENLHLFGQRIAKFEPVERDRLAGHCFRAVGQLVGRMHVSGISNRDLKGANILVRCSVDSPVEVYLIDFDGLSKHNHLSRRQRIRELVRLAVGLDAHPWVTPKMVLRFLKGYIHEMGKGEDWKMLWRETTAALARESERRRRQGLEMM